MELIGWNLKTKQKLHSVQLRGKESWEKVHFSFTQERIPTTATNNIININIKTATISCPASSSTYADILWSLCALCWSVSVKPAEPAKTDSQEKSLIFLLFAKQLKFKVNHVSFFHLHPIGQNRTLFLFMRR